MEEKKIDDMIPEQRTLYKAINKLDNLVSNNEKQKELFNIATDVSINEKLKINPEFAKALQNLSQIRADATGLKKYAELAEETIVRELSHKNKL